MLEQSEDTESLLDFGQAPGLNAVAFSTTSNKPAEPTFF